LSDIVHDLNTVSTTYLSWHGKSHTAFIACPSKSIRKTRKQSRKWGSRRTC